MVRLMIKDNNAFVWNADDWLKLRKEYRLLGFLFGCLAQVPRQDILNGLPMKLLPEEVTLIKELEIGQILTYSDPKALPSTQVQEEYKEYNDRVQKEQVEYCEEKRKKEIHGMIDRIVEGKRRKLSKSDQEAVVDRDAILKAELEKSNASNFIAGVNAQTPIEHPWFRSEDFKPADWNHPITPLDQLKYKVFKDLWDKGYYISAGTKFGGHFLVYPGEPLKFHAFFIVLCVPHDRELPLSKIVAHSRLGTVTKKTFVIASEKEGELVYNSFEWTGIT